MLKDLYCPPAAAPACPGAWRLRAVAVEGIHRRCLFFFQAEDGIRDVAVTGVQTCALPIFAKELESRLAEDKKRLDDVDTELDLLGREQRLEEQKEFSKPETQQRREAPARLVAIGNEIVTKDTEVQGLQERIARLEDQIEDTKRHPPTEAEQRGGPGSSEAIQAAKEEIGRASCRER